MTTTSTLTLERKFDSAHGVTGIAGIATNCHVWSFGHDHGAIRCDVVINSVDYEFSLHLYTDHRLREMNYNAAYLRGAGNRERHEAATRDAIASIVPVVDGWVRDRGTDPLMRKGTFSLDRGTDSAVKRAWEHLAPAFAQWLNTPDGCLLRSSGAEENVAYLQAEAHSRITELTAMTNQINGALDNLRDGQPIPYDVELRIKYLKLDDPNTR